MIEIDGSRGEGGGQIVRTALALSLATGQAFEIRGIRAGRGRPGLQRQHLASVAAAATVGGLTLADVEGASLGSSRMVFRPGSPRSGDYRFIIGSAGSTTLVFQTVLPALLGCEGPSIVTVEGGTHNDMAPPFEYLDRTFLAALRKMGARVEATLERHGFYPAGGGRFSARMEGGPGGEGTLALKPVDWLERGALTEGEAIVVGSRLPDHVFSREAETLRKLLGWPASRIRVETVESAGPGNVILVDQPAEHAGAVVAAVGRKGRPAEEVAKAAAAAWRAWAEADVPVDGHLADQLLLPMALSGGGRFRTTPPTLHTRTNIGVIRHFLPVEIVLTEESDRRWLVEVRGRAEPAG